MSSAPLTVESRPDGTVLGVTMVVAGMTAVLFGLLPALRASRTDVDTNLKSGARVTGRSLMGRALVAVQEDRTIIHENKDAAIIELTLGKNPPKLYPPKDGEQHGIKIIPQNSENQKVPFRVVATRISLEQLSATFARHLDRVLVNHTGLKGDFDFSFDLVPDGTMSPLDETLLVNALRDQLGLKVKLQKAPVDTLIIDRVERVAAGN
jgi:uncharacterized protein (TIGR03435 family)